MGRRRIALLCVPLLLAACGGAAGPRQHAAPAPAHARDSTPPGFRRHVVTNAGLSVALPVGWQVLAQRDAVFPGVRENLVRLSRSFAFPLAALGAPDSPLKLFAFDRSFLRGRPTTIQVVQETYRRPGPFNSWAPRMAAAIRAGAPGLRGPVTVHGVDLPVGLSLEARYRTRNGDTVVVYLEPGRTGLWALLLRTPTARAASDSRTFARTAWSLVVGPAVGGPYSIAAPPGS